MDPHEKPGDGDVDEKVDDQQDGAQIEPQGHLVGHLFGVVDVGKLISEDVVVSPLDQRVLVLVLPQVRQYYRPRHNAGAVEKRKIVVLFADE